MPCFSSIVVLNDYCKLLSTQGPTSSLRLLFSSIPNQKGLSSIHLATIATRPLPSVKQQHPSSQPGTIKSEVLYRTIARYVWDQQLLSFTPNAIWYSSLGCTTRRQGALMLGSSLLDFLIMARITAWDKIFMCVLYRFRRWLLILVASYISHSKTGGFYNPSKFVSMSRSK